jgi:hypothetical protein
MILHIYLLSNYIIIVIFKIKLKDLSLIKLKLKSE